MIKALSHLLPLAVAVSLFPVRARAATSATLQSMRGRLAQPGADQGAVFNAVYDGSQGREGAFFQLASTLPSGQPRTQKDLKETMLQNLEVIKSVFSAQYGPGLWKEGHEGWDLDKQIAAAKRRVERTPDITMDQYHEILRDFFHSMKDYHVSVSFQATETSSLPFGVVGARGRYFIAWIDRAKLPASSFPFNVGDELVTFGGRKTSDVVKELQARLGNNTEQTDRALAAMLLTSRKAASFGAVQQGGVAVGVRPRGSNQVVARQLSWEHNPEQIGQQPVRFRALDFNGRPVPIVPQAGNMLSPMQEAMGGTAANPYSLGSRQSFLPDFGEKTWTSEEDSAFYAYIYKNADGKSIGYVRIPSYENEDFKGAVAEFGALMKDLQKKTDALIIDQVNNPGGAVLYLYALASMLSDRPLSTPPHRVAITQEDVSDALNLLKLEPLIKNDMQAKALIGAQAAGYPVDYGFFRRLVDYSRFVIDQWNKGKTLTDPVHIEGVDAINPSAVAQYTKPVLLLINELDFSGGDFFPAIMQDNRRATLFGTRTAGAGGFIRQVKIPNQVGIDHFVVTGSIAVRATNQPIENLGVRADVQYAPTPDDLQNGFKGYVAAANAAVSRLIAGAAPVGR